jgi:hypothetical protein
MIRVLRDQKLKLLLLRCGDSLRMVALRISGGEAIWQKGGVVNANPLHRLGGIICLSGIDSTGKTTLSIKLKNELNSLGITCNYVWLLNARFLRLPLLALC